MKAVKYKHFIPIHSLRAMPVRCALSQLAGSDALEVSHRLLVKAFRSVLGAWRRRVYELHEAGWARLNSSGQLSFALNCPPCGVVTDRGHTPCDRRHICPFCWCRGYTLPVYDRLVQLVDDLGGQCEIHEVLTEHKFSADKWTITDLFTWIKTRKGQLFRDQAPGVTGAYVHCHVTPAIAGWVLHHNMLLMLPPGHHVALPAKTKLAGVSTQRTIRKQRLEYGPMSLAATVGRVTLYPRDLLHAPIEDVLPILVAREMGQERGVRMSDFYGRLRTRTNPVSLSQEAINGLSQEAINGTDDPHDPTQTIETL